MANRDLAQKMIFELVKEVDPTGFNTKQYEVILAEMTDKMFGDYMKAILDGEASLVLFAPPYKVKGITVENLLRVAKKYGIPIYERLVYKDPIRGTYTLPHETLLADLPINRKSQNLDKKSSIPRNNKIVDQLTYTPTGESKGSTLSKPELGILNNYSLNNCITELIRPRGGDKGGYRAYNSSADKLGSISLKSIEPYFTGVQSTKAVEAFLAAAHLKLEV